ncbi:hypothetical protein [Rodentibacter trehalosifermentans]|uniref:hypothetical protein n=1 Tax=Rodentibacter trehalosifermentans TaxID=1908263 RepID=UPI0013F5AD3F|nr:hypothetical protein [Rodentibacter trehalosifermentans]
MRNASTLNDNHTGGSFAALSLSNDERPAGVSLLHCMQRSFIGKAQALRVTASGKA